jgi:hypothetical protein
VCAYCYILWQQLAELQPKLLALFAQHMYAEPDDEDMSASSDSDNDSDGDADANDDTTANFTDRYTSFNKR